MQAIAARVTRRGHRHHQQHQHQQQHQHDALLASASGGLMKRHSHSANGHPMCQDDIDVCRHNLRQWIRDEFHMELELGPGLEELRTGVVLCKVAGMIELAQTKALLADGKPWKPMRLKFNEKATIGSFFAKDNVNRFLAWCARYVDKSLLFKLHDLNGHPDRDGAVLGCLTRLARSQVASTTPLDAVEHSVLAGTYEPDVATVTAAANAVLSDHNGTVGDHQGNGAFVITNATTSDQQSLVLAMVDQAVFACPREAATASPFVWSPLQRFVASDTRPRGSVAKILEVFRSPHRAGHHHQHQQQEKPAPPPRHTKPELKTVPSQTLDAKAQRADAHADGNADTQTSAAVTAEQTSGEEARHVAAETTADTSNNTVAVSEQPHPAAHHAHRDIASNGCNPTSSTMADATEPSVLSASSAAPSLSPLMSGEADTNSIDSDDSEASQSLQSSDASCLARGPQRPLPLPKPRRASAATDGGNGSSYGSASRKTSTCSYMSSSGAASSGEATSPTEPAGMWAALKPQLRAASSRASCFSFAGSTTNATPTWSTRTSAADVLAGMKNSLPLPRKLRHRRESEQQQQQQQQQPQQQEQQEQQEACQTAAEETQPSTAPSTPTLRPHNEAEGGNIEKVSKQSSVETIRHVSSSEADTTSTAASSGQGSSVDARVFATSTSKSTAEAGRKAVGGADNTEAAADTVLLTQEELQSRLEEYAEQKLKRTERDHQEALTRLEYERDDLQRRLQALEEAAEEVESSYDEKLKKMQKQRDDAKKIANMLQDSIANLRMDLADSKNESAARIAELEQELTEAKEAAAVVTPSSSTESTATPAPSPATAATPASITPHTSQHDTTAEREEPMFLSRLKASVKQSCDDMRKGLNSADDGAAAAERIRELEAALANAEEEFQTQRAANGFRMVSLSSQVYTLEQANQDLERQIATLRSSLTDALVQHLLPLSNLKTTQIQQMLHSASCPAATGEDASAGSAHEHVAVPQGNTLV
ncbi:hypothetical protein PTSG_05526 [Salpingoeca rosetta]|uniref:Calponin-homology (CH) domain-containing protein n=1 Tax=Salpingoeca rosetta (strain ATCC 50818 / BSB-021) TaxID=946362 RepID=F2UBG6_SALR5|nr:uncharacterized protein PTSG_05526 [Salpingoeca rosetta]EGD73832.1 hypothetical protein PTSG_05526 [Salpingoeca rosetta]|eukprot:XP_004993395.1 hypothetical protein PTSG_05526 [Salpingoeca rosetta]